MSNEKHSFESKADTEASKTYPQQTGAICKNEWLHRHQGSFLFSLILNTAVVIDTMIIQAIGLLDDLDKELNTYAMRVREWYGWHLSELDKIVQDNIHYAKSVKLMADCVNAAKLDFSEVRIAQGLLQLGKGLLTLILIILNSFCYHRPNHMIFEVPGNYPYRAVLGPTENQGPTQRASTLAVLSSAFSSSSPGSRSLSVPRPFGAGQGSQRAAAVGALSTYLTFVEKKK
ncbi:hypothetical protein ACFE04_022232 [Oxalis oulophora]